MKVLLCTPYNINPQVVQGGIAIWAQNIVDYYRMLGSDVQLHVVPFDRKVRPKTKRSGGIVKRAWTGFSDYRKAIKETFGQLKREHYDVLHLCSSASISMIKDVVVMKMARRFGVKSVIHFHFGRIPELSWQSNWEWKLLRRVIRLADETVIMDMKSYAVLKDQNFENVHYLPNPLSRSIMKQIAQESFSIKREKRKLCFVGHVISTKGVFEMVKACRDIKDIKLHIFGKAEVELRAQMKQIAGGDDWLVFEGEVDHQRVIRELLSSNIFVLPTYTEGFPNVILESMACGCAIVTTPVGAIPEMLDIDSSEPCGLCCSPKDADGLRRNIQFFLDHPIEACLYAERAKKRVNEMYAVDKVWEQLVRIWRIS